MNPTPRFSVTPLALIPALSAALLFSLSSVSQAATIYWDGTGTSWNAVGNWSTSISANTPNPVAAPGASDVATFSINGVNALQAVTLDANQSASGLSFNSSATGGVMLTGGGTDRTLTLGAGGIAIDAAAGAVTVGSTTSGQGVSLVLTGNQSWVNDGSSLLTINNDVTNSAASVISLTGSGSGGVLVNGIISDGAGKTGLTVNNGSASAITTLTGANTYSGPTTLSTGSTVVIGNDDAFGTSAVTFTSATVKTDNQARTVSNKFNISGQSTVGGSGDLAMTGAVAAALTANTSAFLNFTNTGTTTVSGGLSLNNAVSGAYNNNGEGIAFGSSSNLLITGAITDNNSGNIGGAAAGSLLTLKFTGAGSNVSLTPTVANNGFGGNSTAVNVVNGTGTYMGYNTITIDGPGTNITPFGLKGITSNANVGAIAFLQAASSGKTLDSNISTGASVMGGSGFGFAGSHDLTLGGSYSSGSTGYGGGSAFFNLATGTFIFGNTVSLSTASNATTFTVFGSGATVFNSDSSLIQSSPLKAGNLSKVGTGTMTLAGSNTLLGSTSLLGGTVVLDYSVADANRLAAGTTATALTLGGVDLQLKGGAYAQTLGVAGGTTLVFGQSTITQTNSGASTLALGGLKKSAGSVIDFQTGVANTTTANTSGILGGYATVGGADWATGGGTIAALGSYDSFATPGTNKNILQAGNGSIAANTTVNSLKITTSTDAQSLAIDAEQILSLTSGGLLFTGTNDYAITGGSLRPTASSGDFIVHQYGSGVLQIDSIMATSSAGTSTLTKAGAGTLILTGDNTYIGATYIADGTLRISADNNLGVTTTAAINLNGGTLQTTTGFATARSVGLGANGGTIQVDAGTLGVSGVVSSTNSYGGLTKTGAGTLLLSGANSFKGAVNVNAGTLQLGNVAALGASAATSNQSMSPVTVSGGTLDIAGFAPNVGNVTLVSGSITDIVGTGSLAAYSFTLQSGTVGAALADMVITGNLNNSINVTKTTAGTVTLSGVNTYTGNTRIDAGTLFVNGSLSDSSLVVTNNGGRIGGLGTVGNVAFNTGASLAYDVANVAQSGDGLTADSFTGAGLSSFTLFLSGAATGFDTEANYTWTVLSSADVASISLSSITLDTFGFGQAFAGGFNVSKDAGAIYVNYVGAAIPEPASFALFAGLGILGLSAMRRRRC